MGYQPTFSSLLTEITVAIMFALALVNAWGQGRRWLSTVVWGGAAGYAAEYFIVHSQNPRYTYSATLFWATPLDVPIAIGLGWGIVFYAATWTAQRLRIQNIGVSSLIAGVLGANVDLSLDPVAHQHGFWRWNPPPPPFKIESTLFGVPFDNFVAWVALIGVYGFLVRWAFRRINKDRYHHAGMPGGALLSPVPISGRGLFLDLIVPPLAAVTAGLGFVLVRNNADVVYGWVGRLDLPVGEAIVFGVIFIVGFFAFWNHVLRSSRNEEANAVVLLIPLYLHLLSFYLLLDKIITDNIATFTPLLVLLPLNLVAGMLAFAWPSLDTLLDGHRKDADERLPLMQIKTLSSYAGTKVRALVCKPRTRFELVSAIEYAKQNSKTITFRAGGQSFDSQALNDQIVISLERFDQIGPVEPAAGGGALITVGAGAKWGDILKKTLALGFAPFVMVTSSAATAGGTLSSNSMARFSASCGREGRYVESFHLLTPDGAIQECSRTRNADLFSATIGGLGYVGAVLDVTYRLLKLPSGAVVETEFTRVDGLERIAKSATHGRQDGKRRFAELVRCLGTNLANTTEERSGSNGRLPVALSAVVQMRGGAWGLVARSRYVERRPLNRSIFHNPTSLGHLALQFMATIPFFRWVGYWLTFNVAYRRPKTHVDEAFGYTFFEDGNRKLRRILHFLGVPGRILQQTFIIPTCAEGETDALESFLESADKYLDGLKLEPALIDVLYVGRDADTFLLSSSRELDGYAVTFTFERLFRSIEREQKAMKHLSVLCDAQKGRVHLVKNVCADTSTIENMYGQFITVLQSVRDKNGALSLLRNEFSQRVLRRIESGKPCAVQNGKRHTESESSDSNSCGALVLAQREQSSRPSM